MSLLLDTHVLLWLAADDRRLGPQARAAALSGAAHVSAISVWEIDIKSATGRLDATGLDAVLDRTDFPELPFTARHAREADTLPPHHATPSTGRSSGRPASTAWCS